MKTIKLLMLKLTNFKGIKDLTIDLGGNDVDIYGDNASGKTTINDAFLWLLFNKDTLNRTVGIDESNFQIKTYDKDGNTYHGLDHSVKALLEIDGKSVILQKVYKEKWTKKHGEAERQLTGNTTDHYIDEVPVKKKEYDEYISSIIDEKIFKLITSPWYFNEKLNKKERRKTLFEICGDIDDDLVIDSNKKLEKLRGLLNDNTVEELRAKVRAKKKLLNDDLKQIPIRIDELVNSMPVVNEEELKEKSNEKVILDNKITELSNEIDQLNNKINDIDKQILDLSNVQAGWDNKNKLLSSKKFELQKLKDKVLGEIRIKIRQLEIDRNNLADDIIVYSDNIKKYENKVNENKDKIEKLQDEITKLRNDWSKENEKKFEVNEDFTCPTCGQELPEEMKENKIDKLKSQFESAKKNRLNEINYMGKKHVQDKEKLEEKNKDYVKKIEDLKNEIKINDEKIGHIEKEIAAAKAELENIDFTTNDEYITLKNEISKLEIELQNPDDTATVEKDRLLNSKKELNDKINVLKANISALDNEKEEINKVLASVDQVKKNNARIEELKDQERKLANEIAELEGQEYLTEEFIRTKVDLLESRINSKFKTVKFKMFNTLVNGALEETCETLINGVPFSNANNAAKINAGLDIINTLTEHYGVQAPIFIDNRESVNKLIQCNSQIISLIVSTDKSLRIETKNDLERIGA